MIIEYRVSLAIIAIIILITAALTVKPFIPKEFSPSGTATAASEYRHDLCCTDRSSQTPPPELPATPAATRPVPEH